MRNFKIIITITIILLFSPNLFATDTLSIKFFPMHVGDFFVFKVHYRSNAGWQNVDTVYKIKTKVTQSQILNNHVYYTLQNYPVVNYYLLRADSLSGSLRQYDTLNTCNHYYRESMRDSLAAVYGDSVKNCDGYYYNCSQLDTDTIFNNVCDRKIFSYASNFYHLTFCFSKGFGITNYDYDEYQVTHGWYYWTIYTLVGCRINGVIYGDTSTMSINSISCEISDNYSLFQNYPNPFNPSTKIKYSIPERSPTDPRSGTLRGLGDDKVVLKVSNILGKEIATLVNEKQSPGTYEVTFDGSGLPSGVYFYSLKAEDYVETKKMLLIK